MGQTIACANQKGGVGKTTTVVNLGSYLAIFGERVLIVDLDPQGNATSGLGFDRNSIERSVYDAIVDGATLRELIVPGPVEGLDVVPSTIALAGAEVELAPVEGRERRLSRLLAEIDSEYDYILIDCPPTLGILTVNALNAVTEVLVPVECHVMGLHGLAQLWKTVELVKKRLNPELAVTGILACRVDRRTKHGKEVVEKVRLRFPDLVFETEVRENVKLAECPSQGGPITAYDSKSYGAADYRKLAEEVIAQESPEGIVYGQVANS